MSLAYAHRVPAFHPFRHPSVRLQVDLGKTLEEFLSAVVPDAKLRRVMSTLAECGRTIDHKVKTASCGGTACTNVFGDEQLAVDVLADKLLFEGLQHCGACEIACSEENPVPLDMGGKGYSVCFDPLDGSSGGRWPRICHIPACMFFPVFVPHNVLMQFPLFCQSRFIIDYSITVIMVGINWLIVFVHSFSCHIEPF